MISSTRTAMYRAVCSCSAGGLLLLGAVKLATVRARTQEQQSAAMQSPPTQSSSQQSQGAMSSAGVHAALLDSQNRPITAGGFVDNGPIIFQNVAEKAELTAWWHVMGTPEKPFILESNGSGVAFLDYDNDGWLDIYLVSGSTYDALAGKTKPPHAALFHNNPDARAHARLFHAIFAQGDTAKNSLFLKCPITLVHEEQARRRIARHKNVRPTVFIEVG